MMRIVWGLMVDVFEIASIGFFRLHWRRPGAFLAVILLALMMFSSVLVFGQEQASKGLSGCQAWVHMDKLAQHAWLEAFVVGLASGLRLSGAEPVDLIPSLLPKGSFEDLRGIVSRGCAGDPDGHAAVILFKHAGEVRI